MIKPLTKAEITSALIGLSGWTHNENPDQIERRVEAEDFQSALNWLNQIAKLTEEADHHPDLLIHDWNNLKITLTTHAGGGLTTNDIEMTQKINIDIFS